MRPNLAMPEAFNPRHPAAKMSFSLAVLLVLAAPIAIQPSAAQSPGTRVAPSPAAKRPSKTPAAATPAPVPNEPQRTTASFGDWMLRCERPAAAAQTCEVAQTIASPQGQAVAQIAMGRSARGEPLRLTILVPSNVTLAAAPRWVSVEPGRDAPADAASLDLTWRRCLPGGCLADAVIAAETLNQLRERADPSRIAFQDGAGRETALPFSPKGLVQALDALAREEPR